jgi:hypothetical protein
MHGYPLLTGTHAPMAIYTPLAIAAGLWWRRPVTSVELKLGALTTQARLEMQRQSTFWTGSEQEQEQEQEEEEEETNECRSVGTTRSRSAVGGIREEDESDNTP